MNDVWQKWVLFVAAAWNIVGGASALFNPAQHFAFYNGSLTLSDPTQLFFYRCTWINVIAWGAAYLFAAMQPASRTAVLIAGGAGKLIYFAACVSLFLSGGSKSAMLATGAVDVLFATLFLVIVLSRRSPERIRT